MPTDLPSGDHHDDLYHSRSEPAPSDTDRTDGDPIATLKTALRRRAMDYLARREHSRTELELKLAKAFPDTPSEMRAAVLDQLESDNLLSNYRFCESFYRSRVQRGYGPRMIRYELQQRGVDDGMVSEVFAEGGTNWHSQIVRLAARRGLDIDEDKAENQRPTLSLRDWQRHQRYFLSRGFTPDHINYLRAQLDIHR